VHIKEKRAVVEARTREYIPKAFSRRQKHYACALVRSTY